MEVTITNGCHNFSSIVDICFKLGTCITIKMPVGCKCNAKVLTVNQFTVDNSAIHFQWR